MEKSGKPPIGVRCVDVNKGDDEESNCRSLLAAKDFRRKGDEHVFAPLETLGNLLVMAATPKLLSAAGAWEGPPPRRPRTLGAAEDAQRRFL